MKPEAPTMAEFRTGMAQSVLQEIAHQLTLLTRTGESSAIDLLSLPMTLGDRAELEDRLGRGEVDALLSVAGSSEIWETRYAGVWWVRHFGDHERVAAERIEITPIPKILPSDAADIAAAAARLDEDLAENAAMLDKGA